MNEIWIGRAYSMHGEMRNWYKILVGKNEGRDNFEGLDLDGKVIVKWLLKKKGIMAQT
jgi:hypothetical protein